MNFILFTVLQCSLWLSPCLMLMAAAKKRPVLNVKPSSGVLAAHARLPLTVVFAPRLEAPLSTGVLCSVRRMSRPLALNVKGEGYALRDSMQVRTLN